MKTYQVYVYRNGVSQWVGSVAENSEDNARCAALSKFSIQDEDPIPKSGFYIGQDEDFEVSP